MLHKGDGPPMSKCAKEGGSPVIAPHSPTKQSPQDTVRGRFIGRGGPGRRWAVIVLALLLLGTGTLWAFNHGPTPERWLVSLTATLTEHLGAEVSIQSVRLAGIDRITLHGVRIEGDVPVEVGRVVAAFSVGELWRKRETPLAALRWVSVDDWKVALPADTLYEVEWLANLVPDDSRRIAVEDGGTSPGEVPEEARALGGVQLPALGALTEALLGHEWVDGTLDVYLRDGWITFVDDDSPEPALQLQATGGLALGEEQFVLRHMSVGMSDWQATVNGAALPRPDLYVHVTGSSEDAAPEAVDFAHGGDSPLPWQLPVHVAGTWQGEAWLTGRWDSLDAWGLAHVRSAVITQAGLRRDATVGEDATESVNESQNESQNENEHESEHESEHVPAVYEADDVAIEWAYRPGHGVEVMLNAARDGARLQVQGDIAGDGRLNMAVVAANVRVPADVPSLGQWDVSGQVDLSGTLRGTLTEPVLLADVVSDGGYLFGQPFSGLQGTLKLTRADFAFERVRVTQGTADYYLDGTLASADPTYLDLVLRTDNGRAEALTSVLGWDVPVQSGLAGVVEFNGPLGDIAAEGELTLTRGSAWEQPFDRLTGRFHYGGGAFAVMDVTGTVRGGTITVSGGSLAPVNAQGAAPDAAVRVSGAESRTIGDGQAADGQAADGRAADGWQLQLVVEDVPIQAAPLLRERLPMVSGLLGFVGTMSNDGNQWNPRLAGAVTGRHVTIGSFDFVDAAGDIEWFDGTLSSKGLTLQRRNGGVYDVTGHVYDVVDAPRLEIAVGVQGESVGQLLALTDWRLPLLAHSDPVQAQALLQGTPEDPEATIRVETDAVYVVGRPVPLALDLRLRDGRIEVEQLSEPTSRT